MKKDTVYMHAFKKSVLTFDTIFCFCIRKQNIKASGIILNTAQEIVSTYQMP